MTKVKQEKSFVVNWISSKCRENFCGFASSVLKVPKAFVGKTFAINRKSAKTAKPFSCVALVRISLCVGDIQKARTIHN